MMISHKVAQEGESCYPTSFMLRGGNQDFFQQRTAEMIIKTKQPINANQSRYQLASAPTPKRTFPSSLI